MKKFGIFLLTFIVPVIIALCMFPVSYMDWIKVSSVVPFPGLLERLTVPKELLISGEELLGFGFWYPLIYIAILLFKSARKWLGFAVLFHLGFSAERVLYYNKQGFTSDTLTGFMFRTELLQGLYLYGLLLILMIVFSVINAIIYE